MESEIITGQLTSIFRNVFNDETICLNNEITAGDIGSWDSLSHMLMITEVENVFSIKFKFTYLANLWAIE